MKRAPRSRQRHDLYAKYHDYDSEISDLLGECGFRAFQKKGTDHALTIIAERLAQLLLVQDHGLAAMIDKDTNNNIREIWTPTRENFFSRVTGEYLETLWNDLLELKADDPSAKGFASLKKAEKAEKLESLFADGETRKALGVTADQEARIAGWLPEGMA